MAAPLGGIGGIRAVAMGGAGASAPSPEYENAKVLFQINELLSGGDKAKALAAFERLPEDVKGRVFGEVWRICGRPRPESINPTLRAKSHSDFGKVAFYQTPSTDGIERKANSHQQRMAVELCAIDSAFEAILKELPRYGEARAGALVEKLPKKIQAKIEEAIRAKKTGQPSFYRAKNLLEEPSIPSALKIEAVSKVFEQWTRFRKELISKSEEYENLPSTVSSEVLPMRQQAIMFDIFHKAYALFGTHSFPVEADASCVTLRAFAEDVIRKNPEIASSFLMIDSTLVDAIGKAAPAVAMMAAAPIVLVSVEQAQIDTLRASIPLECAISALRAGNNTLAFKEFEKLKQTDQWAVFGEMWRACGRPRPESRIEALRLASTRYFGEDVFLGIPSDDGINRSATPMQRGVALALHRPSVHLDMMKEFISAGKVPEQVCLLRVMTPGMKKLLQDSLRNVLKKPVSDLANYFRDSSVNKAERLEAVAAVTKAYSEMREKIEPLCFEYEALVASNTNVARKIEIIRTVLSLAGPFLSDKPAALPDPRGFTSELDYAKACMAANVEDFVPYLCMVEPSIAAETIAPRRLDPVSLTMSIAPTAAHRVAAGAGIGVGASPDLFRSIIGHNRLAAAKVDHRFNKERTTFTHRGALYRLLSAEVCKSTDFSDTKVVSMGAAGISYSREAILFDSAPGASPKLEAAYRDFVSTRLSGKAMTTEAASKEIADYIHKVVFPRALELDGFISDWHRTHKDEIDFVSEEGASAFDQKSPIIPIDEFIGSKIGMCRHQALVACYFIARLMKERPDLFPASGRLHHVRDNVFGGAHVWAWYIHPDGKTIHHIDPMWNLHAVMERGVKEDVSFEYGMAIGRQLKRLE